MSHFKIHNLNAFKRGEVKITNSLNVTGDLDVLGNISLNGNNIVNTDGSMEITGTAQLNALNVTGNTDIDGTLNVEDATTLQSSLNVQGTAQLNALNVSGNAVFDNDYIKIGNINMGHNNDVGIVIPYIDSGVTKFSGLMRWQSNGTYFLLDKLSSESVNISNDVSVDELGSLILGNLSAYKRLGIGTAHSLINALNVSGNSYFMGNATFTGSLTGNTLAIAGGDSFTVTGNGVGINCPAPPPGSADYLLVGGGIDIIHGWESYKIADQLVLSYNTLGSSVINSSLKTVGTLTNLNVSGNTDINGTLNVEDATTLQSSLEVQGTAQLNALNVTGNITASDFLGNVNGFSIDRFFRRQGRTNATVGPGWMSIATCTNNRHHGEITVSDREPGDHTFIRLHWLHSYSESNITVINTGGYNKRITGVRVLEETSNKIYGTKILQVYVTTSSNYYVSTYEIGDETNFPIFDILTPVIQDSITGYSVEGILDNLDTYGFAHERGIKSGGVIEGTGIISSGNVSGSTLTGILQTASQPNITSVGTLSSLTTQNNIELLTSGDTQGFKISEVNNNRLDFQVKNTLSPNDTNYRTFMEVYSGNGGGGVNVNNRVRLFQQNSSTGANEGTIDMYNGDMTLTSTSSFNVSAPTSNISGNFSVDTNTLYVDSTNNQVGIGLTNPSSTLEVSGNNVIERIISRNTGNNQAGIDFINSVQHWRTINQGGSGDYDIYNQTLGSHALTIKGSNNYVGIGNNNPSATLDVTGNINTSTDYNIGGTLVLSSNTLGSGIVNSSLTSIGTLSSLNVNGNSNIKRTIISIDNQTITNPGLLVKPNDVIGEDAVIEIRGARNASTIVKQSQLVFSNYDNDIVKTNYLGLISGEVTNASTNIGDLVFSSSSDGTTLTERMRITGSGNVGIGTTSPTTKLSIDGDFHIASSNSSWNSTAGKGIFMRFFEDTNSAYIQSVNRTNGTKYHLQFEGSSFNFTGANVGIGDYSNTNPTYMLDLAKSGTDNYMRIGAGGTSTNYSGILLTEDRINWGWHIRHSASTDDLEIGFQDNELGVTNVMYFDRDTLNVGIGTTNPSKKLDVIGDIGINSSDGNSAGSITTTNESTFDNKIKIASSRGSGGITFETNNGGSYGERMRITANGNIGIGTTNPSTRLHVYDNTSSTGTNIGLTIEQDGSGDAVTQYLLTGGQRWVTGIDNSDGDKFKISSNADLNTNNRFTITTGGNVGIGTTNPTYGLDILNSQIDLCRFKSTNTSAGPHIVLTDNDNNSATIDWMGTMSNATDVRLRALEIRTSANGRINLIPDNNVSAPKMTILSSGEVGIGITNPSSTLEVSGNNAIERIISRNTGNSQAGIDFINSVQHWRFINQGGSGNYDIWNQTLSSIALTIKASNNYIGIGTAPSAPLHILASMGSAEIRMEDISGNKNGFSLKAVDDGVGISHFDLYAEEYGSGTGNTNMRFYTKLNGTAAERIRIDNNGNVGIGITNPSYKLHVINGDINTSNNYRIGGTVVLNSNTLGNGIVNSSLKSLGTLSTLNVSGNVSIVGSTSSLKINLQSSSSQTQIYSYSDTKSYFQTSGDLVFTDIGQTQLRTLYLKSDGNVGIGTDSPLYPLDISGNLRASGIIMGGDTTDTNNARFMSLGDNTMTGTKYINFGRINTTGNQAELGFSYSSNNSSANHLSFGFYGSSVSNRMYLTNGGNFGIGTATPNVKLDVVGDIKSTTVIEMDRGDGRTVEFNTPSGKPGIIFNISSQSNYSRFNMSNIDDVTVNNRYFQMGYDLESGISIRKGGNVGIGTNLPNENLTVIGAISTANTGSFGIRITEYQGVNYIQSGTIGTLNSAADLFIGNMSAATGNSTRKFMIKANGNVGIGTDNPSAPLHIQATSNTTPDTNGLYVYNPNNSANEHAIITMRTAGASAGDPFISWDIQNVTGYSMGIDHSDGDKLKIANSWSNVASNTRFTMTTGGNIGLGTTNPTYRLQLSTNSAAKPTSSTWTIASDERIKENIEDANLDICYNDIKNIKLKKFKWKQEYIDKHEVTDIHSLGFIAQEVELINPKTIITTNNEDFNIPDFKSIDKDQLLMSLFGTVKKLQEKNEILENENIIYKEKIQDLENKINIILSTLNI